MLHISWRKKLYVVIVTDMCVAMKWSGLGFIRRKDLVRSISRVCGFLS
jgi:hypothetical protein